MLGVTKDRQEGCAEEVISKMTSSRSSAKGQRMPGRRISLYKDAEAQEPCCSRPVQFASMGLLARAVIGDKTRGVRQAGPGHRGLQGQAEETRGLLSEARA